VAMKRVGDYAISYFLTPLETVARHTKNMPDEFINEAGNGITEEFIRYGRPLVGVMPDFQRLDAPLVERNGKE